MKQNTNHSSDLGFNTLLTLLFIGLKLTGFIDWSWWWVLSPVWGVLALAAIFYGCAWLLLKIKYWRFRK